MPAPYPDDLEDLLESAAKRGASQALREVGLDDKTSAQDIRDLRHLLSAWRATKKTAVQTATRTLTRAFLLSLLIGVAIKLKLHEFIDFLK